MTAVSPARASFELKPMEPVSGNTEQPLAVNPQAAASPITLKREIGLFGGISMSVSSIIGTGIFIFAADVLRQCGSAYTALIIWAAGGIFAAIRALCLAEIGTLLPATGGWYSYILAGVGRAFAFLIMWVSVLISYPCTLAIMSISLAQYLVLPFYDNCDPPMIAIKLIAVVVLLLVSFTNIMEVKFFARLNIFFTIAKVLPLVIIPVTGIVFICLGRNNPENLELDFQNTASNPSEVALAFYASLWAYSGWDTVCYSRSELKNPERTLPLALGTSLMLVTAVYVFVQFGYMIMLSPSQMVSSSAIALDWAEAVGGQPVKFAMSICVAVAILGTLAGAIFSGNKLCYAAAQEGQLPLVFSMIHVDKRTPVPSIFLNTVLAIIYLIPADVSALLNMFGFVGWLTIILSLLAVIILRFRKDYKDLPRPFKMPLTVTVIATIISTYFVIAPMFSSPDISILYGVTFALAGILFIYWPIFWMKIVPVQDFVPAMQWLTRRVQLVLHVVKPDY